MIEKNRLVNYLLDLKKRDDTGALATLRRGLGKRRGTAAMYPYIFGCNPQRGEEEAYFLTASVFAYHQRHTDESVSIGKAVKRLALSESSESLTKRFIRLLNADTEELPELLRGMVSLLKSREIAFNYHMLVKDVKWWNDITKESWARDFWMKDNNVKTEE